MDFIENHIGEFAALLTAFFWTVSALAFESASKRLGSIAVNILRLAIGFIFLSILNLLRRKVLLPTDASVENWFWLSLSGLVGFVFGDLFLFKSYTVIGSRFSMLIMTLLRRWSRVKAATHDIKGMKSLTLGAFFGPFLGVSFSLLSVKFTKTGIASTIMALVPVFILIPAIFMYKQKVTIPEIIGSIISVCGVALFFL